MAREELKINLIIKGENIFMGAQATDCDPKMKTLKGTLQDALAQIPAFVEESNKQWDVAARNPPSSVPEPVAPAPVRTATTRSSTSTAVSTKTAPAKPSTPKFF